MPIRPVLVARTPRRLLPATLLEDRSSVGVLRLRGPSPPGVERHPDLEDFEHWLVVAVVASLPCSEEGAPAPPFGPPPHVVPSDLVPWRESTDLVLRGTVDAGPVDVRVGGVARRFATVAAVGRADLRRDLVTAEGIAATSDVPTPPLEDRGMRWFDVRHATFHAAPPPMRFPRLRGDEEIVVHTASGARRARLPGVLPRLRVTAACLGVPDQSCWARLEEVLVDLDGATARLVYRALVPTSRADARDVARIDVLFEAPPEGDAEAVDFIDHDVPRAAFEHAWEIADAERGERPPALDDAELEIARYESWDHAGPLATLELAAAAALAAELGEQREPRDAVIARHGLTRYTWELEERAWAEALGAPPGPDDGPTLQELWSHAFTQAQAALARPEEMVRTAEDYARITVALEGTEPDRAFERHGIGLGAYQRLQSRMEARAASDRAFASQLEALLARERAAARGPTEGGRFAGLDVDDEEAS